MRNNSKATLVKFSKNIAIGCVCGFLLLLLAGCDGGNGKNSNADKANPTSGTNN